MSPPLPHPFTTPLFVCRRHKFIFHLNSSGKYHAVKEQLKVCLRRVEEWGGGQGREGEGGKEVEGEGWGKGGEGCEEKEWREGEGRGEVRKWRGVGGAGARKGYTSLFLLY